MPDRTGKPHKAGKLEPILNLAPTKANIRWLSTLLERTESAIQIVYKIAFEHGPIGKDVGIQERKIIEAKARIGIRIGRKTPSD